MLSKIIHVCNQFWSLFDVGLIHFVCDDWTDDGKQALFLLLSLGLSYYRLPVAAPNLIVRNIMFPIVQWLRVDNPKMSPT